MPTVHVPDAVLDTEDTALTYVVHVPGKLTNHSSPTCPTNHTGDKHQKGNGEGADTFGGWGRGVREVPAGFPDSLHHSAGIYEHLLCAKPQGI